MVGVGGHLQDYAGCRTEHVRAAHAEEATRKPKQGVRYLAV